jgi:capsular polysaccharide biosynthesis protein
MRMETSERAKVDDTLTADRPEFDPGDVKHERSSATPQRDVWASVRRRPWIVALSAIFFLVVGVVLGIQRAPQYSASTHMVVQIGTSEPAALGGISQAVVAEAASFSRAITSNAVVDPTARSLGLSPEDVSGRVSATPVPQSGDITVTATGSSPRAAVRLVNAVSSSLSSYVVSVSNPGEEPAAILSKYEAVAATVRTLKREAGRLAARLGATGAVAPALGRLEARLQAALLRQETLKIQYQSALLAPTTRLIAFDRPTSASSDRQSRAALLGFIGLLFGLVVGLAALALGSSRAARRARPA